VKTRKPLRITSRSSSITNAFVQAIIPFVEPTDSEISDVLTQFGQQIGMTNCVYCGGDSTDWDHLRPLVRGKRPTGYISSASNLVPACGPCNQSKSGADWRLWLGGNSTGAQKAKSKSGLKERIERLEKFDGDADVNPIIISDLVEPEKLNAYWKKLDEIILQMKEAQKIADDINSDIMISLGMSKS
jgi:hypothetical protein